MYFDVQYMLGASVRWRTGLDSSAVLVPEQYWHLAAHECNCPMVLPNACCNMHTIAQHHANMLCSEAMWCCTALVLLPQSAMEYLDEGTFQQCCSHNQTAPAVLQNKSSYTC
jgi:hypothetical protein